MSGTTHGSGREKKRGKGGTIITREKRVGVTSTVRCGGGSGSGGGKGDEPVMSSLHTLVELGHLEP